jgi:hypothetical protein
MKMTNSVKVFVAALGVTAVVLSGCASKSGTDSPAAAPTSAAPSKAADNGVAALTADQILDKAKAAVKAAKSYTVKGSQVADGQKTTMDFKVAGKDISGTLVLGKAKAQLLAVGGAQYLKANEAFWASAGDAKSAATVTEVIGDRWVKVPAGNKDFAGLFTIADSDDLLQPDGKITKGATAEVDGVPTITLVDGGTEGGKLYVDTVGEPYPVKVDSKDGSLLTFTGFGETVPDATKPTAAQVIDFSKLTA